MGSERIERKVFDRSESVRMIVDLSAISRCKEPSGPERRHRSMTA